MVIKTRVSIVYFGSGPVAIKTLEYLNSSNRFQIEAIITKPSTYSELKNLHPNIPTYGVSNSVELEDLITTELFKSQIGILVDFGVIVSKTVIDYFPLGIVNSHFSLLPEWRGADPITFAILSGRIKRGSV